MVKTPLAEIVVKLESGSRPKGGASNDTGNVPSLGAEHLDNNGGFKFDNNKFITDKYFSELTSGVIHRNDILIVKDGATTGKTSFVDESFPFKKAAINEHVFRVCINVKKAYPRYVFYFLKSPFGQIQIKKDLRGATVGGISRRFVELAKIPIPKNYDDQIRIATLLSRAEALIAKRKESIRLLDELIKSTFLEMFGDPVRNEKGWEHNKIGLLCNFKGGGTPSKLKPEYYTGNIPWVTPKDMKVLFIIDSQDKITEKAIIESSTNLISQGSVLMVIRSGILKSKLPVAINKVPVAINQDMKAITSKVLISEYLLYYFVAIEKNLLKKVRATTADNLRLDDIKKLNISVPPLPLQNKFAQIVEKVESIKTKYEASLTELENLYGSLSQRAFRDELDLSRVPIDTAIKPETVEAKLESHEHEVEITKRFSKKELIKIIKSKSGQSFNFDELWNRLDASSFEEQPQYDDVKKMIFNMLEGENPILSQSFDKEKKEIALRINV